MKPMTLPLGSFTEGTKVAIFDLTIENVDERRERRLIAESKALAVKVLKLASVSRLETIIRNKERIMYRDKPVAVRYEDKKYDQPCNNKTLTSTPINQSIVNA